ncbi:hypothetical protein GCM10027160_45450 [Streptomyces calidiresistens]|uniref:Tetratricopeptide repeat protein n=1 Tax=Streptomyces calidiresistens TaxID=1485586 RepID=A0A7W3T0Q5_9ACTN|nr:tetratricopeptide repeat protein [Streptomyces calidiresistens]MBB0228782.1 tetratricopeptide repeat protein [Streptomyces calidiresistens]
MAPSPGIDNTFSGGRADAVIQVGTVHGNVRVDLPAQRESPPPRQLPIPPRDFVNRRESIRFLDDLVSGLMAEESKGPTVLTALAGFPGVGKTALAVHWGHRMRRHFPDGDLYVDMQGHGPGPALTAMRALDLFLRAMDVLPERIPETLEERSALFRTMTSGKRMLVVIDNVPSPALARPLLPSGHRCCVVVTSRNSLAGLVIREGAKRVPIDVLSPEESVELLTGAIGSSRVEQERESALRLAELCGHLPLMLRIVGERAASRPYLTLGELADEVAEEQRKMDMAASTRDESSDTRGVFSWSYRALSEEDRRAFRFFSLHPGPDIGVHAFAALLGEPLPTAGARLRALAEAHLVQEVRAHRYRMHDLMRFYALERVGEEESQSERTRGIRRLLTWYLLTADAGRRAILPHSAAVPLVPAGRIEVRESFADHTEARQWFDSEHPHLVAALRQAEDYGQFDLLWKLAVTISGFLELAAHWTDWEKCARAGVSAARTLGDDPGEALCLLVLADAQWRAGRSEDAAERYREVLLLTDGPEPSWPRGFAVRGLGLLSEEAGDPEAAEAHFETALGIFRDADHRRGQAMATLSLGKVARARGEQGKALSALTRAVDLFEEIDDRWSIAWGKLHLAPILAEINRPAAAVLQAEEARKIFGGFGDPRGEALSLELLGDFSLGAGKREEAGNHWGLAAALYERLGDAERADALRNRLGAG